MTGRSSWARRSSACGRRRTAARRIVSYSLEVEPKEHFLNWQQDPHGNYLARLVIPEPTTRFAVEVGLVAEMAVINPFDFFLEPAAEAVPVRLRAAAEEGPRALSRGDAARPAPARAARLDPAGAARPRCRSWSSSTAACSARSRYVIRMEPGIQSCEETLQLGSGSCRDTRLAAGPDPAPAAASRRASCPAT